MTQPNETPTTLLERVRKLLAKAEDDGVTTAEAEALTAKAAGLMAKYGIDRALLGSIRPESDKPGDKKIFIANPWADVRSYLLGGLAKAMRCQCFTLTVGDDGLAVEGGKLAHLFAYESDLERIEVLYTSIELQMAQALQRIGAPMPGMRNPMLSGSRLRTWNRSFLLGYAAAVVERVRAAEEAALGNARAHDDERGGKGTELVLADRSLVIRQQAETAYPKTRKTRVTYSGRGYKDGHAAGQRADLGGTGVRGGSQKALA